MLTPGSEPADGSILVEAHPDWAAEAGRIVFTRYTFEGRDPNPPKIWAVDPDGTNLVQLTRGPLPDFLPGPDGMKIAFTRELRGPAEVFVMSADGSHVSQLTKDRGHTMSTLLGRRMDNGLPIAPLASATGICSP